MQFFNNLVGCKLGIEGVKHLVKGKWKKLK
jgi:hypothetical protein